jgi:hypothetical protein
MNHSNSESSQGIDLEYLLQTLAINAGEQMGDISFCSIHNILGDCSQESNIIDFHTINTQSDGILGGD